jgi:hypothetical protein
MYARLFGPKALCVLDCAGRAENSAEVQPPAALRRSGDGATGKSVTAIMCNVPPKRYRKLEQPL